jgi:hypothetical protein
MQHSAIIICDSYIEKEPRVVKEIEALVLAGITPIAFSYTKSYPGVVCYDLPQRGAGNKHLSYPTVIRKSISAYKRTVEPVLEKVKADNYYYDKRFAQQILAVVEHKGYNITSVIAHHLHNLPLSYFIAKRLNARLIFNAHEFYPEQFSEYEGWEARRKRLNKIGKDFLGSCYKIFNVCQGIQDRYERDFSLAEGKQVLVTNATVYKNLQPTATHDKIKLVHHGIANKNRKLELMIQIADAVDANRFEFYFMLVPSPHDQAYFDYLKAEIDKRPHCFLIPPVPTAAICEHINRFDVGFYMYDNSSNFNMQHYLPNKLYEFIQARLGVVIGPYVEMKRVVEGYDVGYVAGANTVSAIAALINNLTKEDVVRLKANAHIAAESIAGEKEVEKMAEVFKTL